MDYYELNFTCGGAADKETVGDVLAAVLADTGFESFAPTDEGLSAYIPAPLFDADAVDECIRNFPLENVRISHTRTLIKDRDWNEVWERNYFKPVRIDKRCLLRASFHAAESGFEHEIIINPKMAFGTGNHETTYLMIRQILDLQLVGKDVLDMGCGTAVLSILAAKMGARSVTAIDNDVWAFRNALENSALNDANIKVVLGDADAISGLFDCIFANINRNILLRDIPRYAESLRDGGTLLMSGFYATDFPAIAEVCAANRLTATIVGERNGWVAVQSR